MTSDLIEDLWIRFYGADRGDKPDFIFKIIEVGTDKEYFQTVENVLGIESFLNFSRGMITHKILKRQCRKITKEELVLYKLTEDPTIFKRYL